MWSYNSTSAYIAQRTENWVLMRCLYTQLHSIIQIQQEVFASQVSINRGMDKQNVYPYVVMVFSLKGREKRKVSNMDDPGGQMLYEIGQTQKDKYCMNPLTWSTLNSQTDRDKSRMVVVRGWDVRNGKLLFNGTEFQFGEVQGFWRWIVVMITQQCKCTNTIELST